MEEKEFTFKQVFILVAVLVVGFAFLQTSAPMWTFKFWREFLLNVMVYGAVSEFLVILSSVIFTKLYE